MDDDLEKGREEFESTIRAFFPKEYASGIIRAAREQAEFAQRVESMGIEIQFEGDEPIRFNSDNERK